MRERVVLAIVEPDERKTSRRHELAPSAPPCNARLTSGRAIRTRSEWALEAPVVYVPEVNL